MTEQPNIQKEILEYILEETDPNDDTMVVHLREFAQERGYSEHRVARKASETGVLTCGINMLHPWPINNDRERVKDKLSEWD